MLNSLAQQCYQASKSKGFHNEEEIFDMLYRSRGFTGLLDEQREQIKTAFTVQAIGLIITELSEAIEALRSGKLSSMENFRQLIQDNPDDKYFPEHFEKYIKDSYEDEVADAAIRIFDLCGKLGIDLDSHVHLKMKYNATRPARHGKLF